VALSSEVAGQLAGPSVPGAAAVLGGRPQLVLAVAPPVQELPAAEELIAVQLWGFEPGVEAAGAPGRASASKTVQRPAVRACLPDARHSVQ
jgi:hypothetical protein